MLRIAAAPEVALLRADDGLLPLVADSTRLVHILHNLLSNAARFSATGGEVGLAITGSDDRMLVIVEDEGAAMTA